MIELAIYAVIAIGFIVIAAAVIGHAITDAIARGQHPAETEGAPERYAKLWRDNPRMK
jgi:multisubunit Na+/H+ antiporter MnhG subunit